MNVQPVHSTDGPVIQDCVVQIWDDLHNERSGYFRAFWCASPEATNGSPVIGYCSPGGTHRTIRAVAREVWHHYPGADIFRNGRRITWKQL